MTKELNDGTRLRDEIDGLKQEIDALKQGRRSSVVPVLRRAVGMAGALMIVSALGFGALTAAGVEALHIDEQGNVHILGAVVIGGAATVGSVTTTGAVTAGSVASEGAIAGGTVTSAGVLTAGSVTTGGEVAADAVTASTVTAGQIKGNGADISGVIVDANGNMAIPGNLSVAGQSDRLYYTSDTLGKTTFINPDDLARLCADGDGCEVRMAMFDYNTVPSAAASVSTTFYCDATCTQWRTGYQLLGDDAGLNIAGEDDNGVVQHVIWRWSCYFTDGIYESTTVADDTQHGFGLLLWTEYPGSRCTMAIID